MLVETIKKKGVANRYMKKYKYVLKLNQLIVKKKCIFISDIFPRPAATDLFASSSFTRSKVPCVLFPAVCAALQKLFVLALPSF